MYIQFVKIIINNALDTKKNHSTEREKERKAKRIINKDSKNSLFGHSIQDSYTLTQNKMNNAEKISRSKVESKKEKKTNISVEINEYETMEKKNKKNEKTRNENFPPDTIEL